MLNTVFVIDDDPISNLVSETVLKKIEFAEHCYTFEDPKKALKEIDALKPEAIFLDIVMPGLDGWSFIETCREQFGKIHSKIIMLTASLKPEDENRANEIEEVIDIISKPLSKDFLEALKKRIEH